jgi:hypothetical protein
LSIPTIWSRVGSASAFRTSTESSTMAGLKGSEGGEHTPLTRSGATFFTRPVYQLH